MDEGSSPGSRYAKWLLILALAVLLEGVLLPAAAADSGVATLSGGAGEVSVWSAGATGITFTVRVPWEQLALEPVTEDGVQYVRVSLPGWAAGTQAGAPALPLWTESIGVPFGVEIAVWVLPGPAHTLKVPAPALPAATLKAKWTPPDARDGDMALPLPDYVLEQDAGVYGSDGAYPADLARVASDGLLRQQRVAGIVVSPVQYYPATREVTVYESLRVEVRFSGAPEAGLQAARAESVAYESVLRGALLNYETAKEWRRALTPNPSPSTGEGREALTPNPSPSTGEGREALTPSPSPNTGEGSVTLTPSPSPNTGEGSSVWAPPVPGWRIKVRAEGVYRLTYAELQNAGLPVGTLDPRTFRLYHLGAEVAIDVAGQDDGRFDPADDILFYGQGLTSKYTADNVYWLTYGQGTGLRMGTRSGAPGAGQTPASYPAFRHMEQNARYLSSAPGSDDLDRFMWDYVYAPSRPSWTYTFALTAPYAAPATLRVALLGYLQNAITPDHHATITLNGTRVGDVRWDGLTWHIAELAVPQGLLVAGNNNLSIAGPNDTGVGIDVFYLDWAELQFASAFRAVGDALGFGYTTPGTWKYAVDGFSHNQVAIYDITNPAAVVRIEGASVASSALGFTATFQDSIAADTRYWMVATGGLRTVQAIEQDTASNLQSTGNGADYIIITPQAFASQAAQLRDLRTAQGWRAVLVDVQDVYDEFGCGIAGALPIRDFLARAYAAWQAPAPSFAVLVGDGHYDPKDYLGYGRVSYMPPYLAVVDPWIGETAGDNRYVTLVGADTLPDMMLGRLAVNSAAEAGALVSKILAYEQTPTGGDWQRRVLAVADNADSAGDFALASDALLAGYLPPMYQATRVYYGITHTNLADARAAIQSGINAGALIVNYIGHGGWTVWAEEGLLKAADVPALANGRKTPVILAMTCLDGYFHFPQPTADGLDCMAELLTRAADKGAVASWSPTGKGISTGHGYLDRGFFEAKFQTGQRTLGEGTAAGKLKLWTTGANLDLLDTYLLFGDPAMRMLPDEGLAGDVNGDCAVDIVDIMLVANHWNTRPGDPDYDARYDLDASGMVDIVDIMLAAAQWNTHC